MNRFIYRGACLILFLITLSFDVYAQYFFLDSTKAYTFVWHVGEGNDFHAPGIQVESIELGKVKHDTQYYHYNRRTNFKQRDTIMRLSLMEHNKRLYVSGNYFFSILPGINFNDTVVRLDNYLIYDYNLVPGDTFWFSDPFSFVNKDNASYPCYYDGLNYYVIDKVTSVRLEDGNSVTQQVLQYRGRKKSNTLVLGSSTGVLGHLRDVEAESHLHACEFFSTFSVCHANGRSLFREIPDDWLKKYFNGDLCDSLNILAGQRQLVSDRTPLPHEPIFVWPNPTSSALHINRNYISYSISDLQGRTVTSGSVSKNIVVQDLCPGLYILHLETKAGIALFRFLKE
ncbi:MAG: T9SS type A sorting domain-containing protein [Bacteroidia bacterium]|nr:T9SS type A sorting domain-containing protein [Bacteroidia bacterium]